MHPALYSSLFPYKHSNHPVLISLPAYPMLLIPNTHSNLFIPSFSSHTLIPIFLTLPGYPILSISSSYSSRPTNLSHPVNYILLILSYSNPSLSSHSTHLDLLIPSHSSSFIYPYLIIPSYSY